MPITFLPFITSFRKIAESTRAMSGILVVIMEASTGDAIFTPKIKQPWLKTMASIEAANIFIISRPLTRSGFWKNDAIQNSAAAPTIRSSVTAKAPIAPHDIANFATGDISPHIAFAANIAP